MILVASSRVNVGKGGVAGAEEGDLSLLERFRRGVGALDRDRLRASGILACAPGILLRP